MALAARLFVMPGPRPISCVGKCVAHPQEAEEPACLVSDINELCVRISFADQGIKNGPGAA